MDEMGNASDCTLRVYLARILAIPAFITRTLQKSYDSTDVYLYLRIRGAACWWGVEYLGNLIHPKS